MTTEWYRYFFNLYGFTGGGTGAIPTNRGGTGQIIYTNGQLLIGNSTTGSLDKATITGGAGINVTNGPGSIALSLGNSGVTPGNYGNASTVPQLTINEYGIISLAANVSIAISATQIVSGIINPARISGNYSGITGVGTITSGVWQGTSIGVPYGGTGLSSYTLGDLLYATGTTALSKLAIGANTYILASTGTAPQWVAPSTISIGTATNLAGGAANRIAYQTGVSTTSFIVAPTIAGTYLNWSGSAFQWSSNPLGDVVGPSSATDNAIARFDTTTGKLIQNSVVTIDDTGAATGFTTLSASTSVTSPIFKAANSAGGALQNASGTNQIQWGAGGGDNASINVSTNINGANAQIDISPTGTGHVHMKPTGTGAVEIAPTNVGTMDNMTIGATTPRAITGTTITATTFNGSGSGLTSIPNSALTNSTISGVALGGNLFNLTAGTGVSFNTGTTYNGSAAITINATGTGGTVTSVSGTAPISVATGTTTPVISISQATTSTDGYLSSTDWNTFNNKQPAGSYLTAVSIVSANGFAGTSSGGTTPALTLSTSITGILKGNGTAISAATSGTDYAPATSGTSILYGNGAGGFSNVTIGTGVAFAGGTLSATGLGGDVVGPASATDEAIARFDTTTGKLIQNSSATINDSGQLALNTGAAFGTALLTLRSDASASTTPSIAMDGYGGSVYNIGFRRANGTIASPTATLATTIISILGATTGDGTTYANTSAIQSALEATATPTSQPTALLFAVTPSGSISRGEVLRLRSTGAVAFSGATNYGTSGQVLQSNGNAAPTWTNTPTLTGTNFSAIPNSALSNSTISGVALGGSLFNLTAGTGVSFSAGTTYNGSTAITINATGTGGTVTSVAALTLGTTGTDLSSTVANGTTTPVITLNVPTASAANRGALSSTDWSTFNGKANAFTYTSSYIPYGQGTTTPTQSVGLQYDGTTFTTTGISTSNNLAFTGTGNRITGDFSNATISSRVAFQTSTVNGATEITTIPNGTGVSSNTASLNNSNPTNSGRIRIGITDTISYLDSGRLGTGTYLPLLIYTNGSERLRVFTSGGVSIGNTTDPGATNLSVTGTISSSSSISATTTVTATTSLKANLALGSGAGVDTSGQTGIVIAASGNALLITGGGYYLVSIAEVTTTGLNGVYVLGNGSVTFLGGIGWVATTTTPGASTYSIAYSGGNYRIYNGFTPAGTYTFKATVIRMH
jgi:hypothetical protein